MTGFTDDGRSSGNDREASRVAQAQQVQQNLAEARAELQSERPRSSAIKLRRRRLRSNGRWLPSPRLCLVRCSTPRASKTRKCGGEAQ